MNVGTQMSIACVVRNLSLEVLFYNTSTIFDESSILNYTQSLNRSKFLVFCEDVGVLKELMTVFYECVVIIPCISSLEMKKKLISSYVVYYV